MWVSILEQKELRYIFMFYWHCIYYPITNTLLHKHSNFHFRFQAIQASSYLNLDLNGNVSHYKICFFFTMLYFLHFTINWTRLELRQIILKVVKIKSWFIRNAQIKVDYKSWHNKYFWTIVKNLAERNVSLALTSFSFNYRYIKWDYHTWFIMHL